MSVAAPIVRGGGDVTDVYLHHANCTKINRRKFFVVKKVTKLLKKLPNFMKS